MFDSSVNTFGPERRVIWIYCTHTSTTDIKHGRHARANPNNEEQRLTCGWMCGSRKGLLTIGHSPESLLLELQHLVSEAHSLLPYDILAGHTHVIEKHFCCIR